MPEAPPVGVVELLQLLLRPRVPHELMARQQLQLVPALGQALGHAATDHVDDHAAGDGRDRAGAPLQPFDLHDAIARGGVVVDDHIGDVGELFARGVPGGRGVRVPPRDNPDHREAAPFRAHGHLDDHRPQAAGRDQDEPVIRPEIERAEQLLCVALALFELQRGAQAVRPDDRRVIGQGELDHRHEPGEAPLARRHLLAHHARVPGAEQKDQPPARDPLGANLRRPLDLRRLRALELLQQVQRGVEVITRGGHSSPPFPRTLHWREGDFYNILIAHTSK